jgi:hypothetical protein
MKSAIIKSLLLYIIGFSITALIYYSADSHYTHGPNLYHLTFVLTILIGTIWLIVATIIYFSKSNKNMIGHMLVNGIATISFVVFMWVLLHPEPLPEPAELDKDELSVARTGDSTLIFHNEHLIYLKVGDSVYLDLKDSTLNSMDFDY